MSEVLGQWACARCGGGDCVNCAMRKWIGPVLPCHGWDRAEEALNPANAQLSAHEATPEANKEALSHTTPAATEPIDETRCPICSWPYAKSRDEGCVPGDCSYRPEHGSEEWRRVKANRERLAGQAKQEGTE